jgi:tetratricopeptide (TPR) repeat protein
MASANGDSRSKDELLDEVVVDYLEAVERGQRPSWQEWLARHPQLADELAGFLADEEKVTRWTAPLRQAAQPASDPNRTPDDRGAPPPLTRVGPFGDYELLEEIARGGMGVVYKARQVSLDRLVAVKMILAGELAAPADIQRFHTEAVAAAKLDHSHIVPIYEVGEHEGQPFFSMKLMEGGSLAAAVSQRRYPPREAAALIATVARAVHHAHQRGILHRDLKPANVLLDAAGAPHVSDFGLAKRVEDASQSAAGVGTPAYMAPEQAHGRQALTTAADTYGLGAILYALLTGGPPLRGKTALETLRLVAEQTPPRPRALNALVDRDLETICLKCLEKEPLQRYPSAQALAEDLERYLAHQPIQARRTPLWVRAGKWARRRPALAALALVSVVAVLGLLTGYLQYQESRARLAEQILDERRRTDSLREQVRSLILQGQETMARAQWPEAKVHLTSAQRLIESEAALADLTAPVERLLAEAERRLQHEAAQRQAERKLRDFRELRAQALFQGTVFTGVDLPASPAKIRATVLAALGLFGVAAETPAGPVFEGPFTAAQRKEVNESCYELLLILAEAVAQHHPPQVRQALRILDRADQLGPRTRAYHLRRARYLEQLGDADGSRRERADAAARAPVEAMDYFLLGEDLHQQGQLEPAIAAFQKALHLRPNDFWARYFLAVCYLRSQPARADLATDSLTTCLAQGRGVLWIYLLRGVSHTQQGQFQAALEDFQSALLQGPNDDARYAIFLNRGVLFRRQGKLAQAVADLKQAIALRPKQYQAYANLAKVYRQQKDFAAALAQLDRALASAAPPEQAGASGRRARALLHRHRAQVQLDRQDPAAALEDYHQVLRLDPGAADHVACGRVLQRLHRYPEAVQAHEAALRAEPGHAAAHLGKAEALFQLERYPEAAAALDGYLKHPNPAAGPKVLADVYRARGLTGAKLGHYADAIADFTLALSYQEDSVTHAYRGWAYLVSKAPELALPDFDKAIALDKNNGDAYYGRGSVRVKLGAKLSDYQEAVADAEKALECGPKADARLLRNSAHIYAQAAARLDAARTTAALKLGAQYRAQALQLLRQALAATPAAERPAFWRKQIEADPDLARFAAALRPG